MSGTFLNYFQVQLNSTSFDIKRIPYAAYKTKDAFSSLKKENLGIEFYRDNDWIYFWPTGGVEIERLGGKEVKINIDEKPSLVSSIISQSIALSLRGLNQYKVKKDKYSSTWSIIKETEDLLDNKIPGLMVKREVLLNSFYYYDAGVANFGICISSNTKNEFIWSREEFKKNGIAVEDLKQNDNRIFANKQSISRFLEATGKEKEYETIIAKINNNSENFKIIIRLFEWIRKNISNIEIISDLKIDSVHKVYLPYKNNLLKEEVLPIPQYYFYSEKSGSGKISDRIKNLRPYSLENFQSKEIVIGIICLKENEGTVELFLKKIQELLFSVFQLKKVKYDIKLVATNDLNGYSTALYSFDFKVVDLVIVVLSEEHKNLPRKHDPYYFCKAKLLGHEIPTQEVMIHNVKKYNEFILDNMVLNIYAKLGGTPWTIEKEDKLKNELVIGIASTTDDSTKTVLGIAQIFNYNGKYLVSDCTSISTFENYSENLELYLKKYIADFNFGEDSEIRLVFHVYKSASEKHEFKAIYNVVESFPAQKITYSIVHLDFGHNFRIFNNDGKSENKKGSFIKIDDLRGLLTFEPKSTIPLLIYIDRRSTFVDLYYIAKQIYWFSHLSYRSYMAAKKPVTLSYPNLLVNLTEKLKKVEGWDYELLKKMGDKLWFI
ncbi:hypothetical protein CH364_09815 [Leptospira harrisiae]|uniref:Protein argonaute n=1 Tax=Leptospira harrisiae TaxID=2023189 RepID=A0A2N0AQB3_9LEPT|nr:Piwi domain-containing protein [Leptospira harrisiae]PJZ86435.1 hypothetical protein CH364_09815 [Leptospira harrisiae]